MRCSTSNAKGPFFPGWVLWEFSWSSWELMVLIGNQRNPPHPTPPQGSSGRESTTLIIIKLAGICTGHKKIIISQPCSRLALYHSFLIMGDHYWCGKTNIQRINWELKKKTQPLKSVLLTLSSNWDFIPVLLLLFNRSLYTFVLNPIYTTSYFSRRHIPLDMPRFFLKSRIPCHR